MNKLFILDTNVILYDYNAIYNFEENDIIIPIVVLEELDRFKKGNDPINLSARAFIRELNNLSDASTSKEFLSLGKDKGKLKIEITGFTSKNDSPIFEINSTDNQLLALCLNTKASNKKQSVILVTKDINLRMKARALGIDAQDYETGKLTSLDIDYAGYRVIEGVSADYIDSIFANPTGVSVDFVTDPVANEFYLLKNGKQSALVTFNPSSGLLEKVLENGASGINPKNMEQIFAFSALLNSEIPLVTLTGTSGSGKTLLALAAGIAQKKTFKQIFISRSPIPVGTDIGFLPGTWEEKLEPYMQSIWDNFSVIKKETNSKTLDALKEEGKIKVEALPFLRGRSLSRIFYIVDEAQNLTPHEVKTIITRAGEGTKLVFTGDIHQIDVPYLDSRSNGLTYLIHKMKGQKLFAHINLVKGERSPLAELASNIL
jgi:PhoH-like ATPase